MKILIICLILIGTLFFTSEISPAIYPSDPTLDEMFQMAGVRYNIDWKLIKAVAIVESRLDPNAIGDHKRSVGIMQVSIGLAQFYDLKRGDLFNPYINIHIGASHLSYLIQKYGLKKGIRIYNAGERRFFSGRYSNDYYHAVIRNYYDLIRLT